MLQCSSRDQPIKVCLRLTQFFLVGLNAGKSSCHWFIHRQEEEHVFKIIPVPPPETFVGIGGHP